MNCTDYLPLLSGHIDQMNTDREETELQAHLRSCPECRRLLSEMQQNDTLLQGSAVLPPDDMTERIMRQVRKDTKKSRVNKPAIVSAVVSGLAVAAIMTLVFWGSIRLPDKSAEALSVPTEAAALAADAVNPADEESPNIDVPAEEVQTPPASEAPLAEAAESIPETAPDEEEQPTLSDTASVQNDAERSKDFSLKRDKPSDGSENPLSSPLLVIWEPNDDILSLFTQYTPLQNDEPLFDGLSLDNSPTLLSRILQSLPSEGNSPAPKIRESHPELTAYRLSLELMNEIFSDCIGKCEVNIYYPDGDFSETDCLILLVRQ